MVALRSKVLTIDEWNDYLKTATSLETRVVFVLLKKSDFNVFRERAGEI